METVNPQKVNFTINYLITLPFLFRFVTSLQDLGNIRLAYYPPYHSKYNPVERVWGIYENHICGDVMDSVETTIKFAESMTYNSRNPIVKLTKKLYKTGVKVGKEAMKKYNEFVERMPSLEKWFLTISPGYFG